MEVRPTRYDAETADLICSAGKIARRMGHSYVGSVHLLLAMVQNRGFAGSILRGFGLNMTVTEDMKKVIIKAANQSIDNTWYDYSKEKK